MLLKRDSKDESSWALTFGKRPMSAVEQWRAGYAVAVGAPSFSSGTVPGCRMYNHLALQSSMTRTRPSSGSRDPLCRSRDGPGPT